MKLILSTIAATAALNLAALAGDLVPVQIANGHGQITVAYRSSEPTVAVFTGGKGITSATSESKAASLNSKDNGHGQAMPLYRAE